MEEFMNTALQSGNATAIIGSLIVYLIIYVQRKNTSTTRDTTIEELRKKLSELQKDNELKQKDINYLMDENNGIKSDIKEMKTTLHQMAISLAQIAAKYKEN